MYFTYTAIFCVRSIYVCMNAYVNTSTGTAQCLFVHLVILVVEGLLFFQRQSAKAEVMVSAARVPGQTLPSESKHLQPSNIQHEIIGVCSVCYIVKNCCGNIAWVASTNVPLGTAVCFWHFLTACKHLWWWLELHWYLLLLQRFSQGTLHKLYDRISCRYFAQVFSQDLMQISSQWA